MNKDCQCPSKFPITSSPPRRVGVFKVFIYPFTFIYLSIIYSVSHSIEEESHSVITELPCITEGTGAREQAHLYLYAKGHAGPNVTNQTGFSLMSLAKLASHSFIGVCGFLECFSAFSDLQTNKSNFP